jgi:hypothetical protein
MQQAQDVGVGAFLDALLSADNDVRNRAEAARDAALRSEAGARQLVAQLAGSALSDPSPARRSTAAVVLRRTVQRDGRVWELLDAATQGGLKATLLRAFLAEAAPDVQRKVAHAIAELACVAAVAPDGAPPGAEPWPELMQAVLTMSQDGASAQRREAALFMLSALLDFSSTRIVGGAAHRAPLLALLARLLGDTAPAVSGAALRACCTLIKELDDDNALAAFVPAVPAMMRVLEAALAAGVATSDEEAAQSALKSLIDVVQSHPEVLRPHIEAVCHAMLVVMSHAGFEEDTRKLGLEFLLSLAEEAGATVRKFPALINNVLTLGLRFLCNVEEDAAWVNRDDDPKSYIGDETDTEASEVMLAGVDAVQRLAAAIRGKLFLPVFFAKDHLPRLMQSADWRERRAGLLALSLILGGCKRELATQLEGAVKQVLPFLDDPHQRVRHAAVRCLGQMAAEFSEPEDASGADSIGLMAESVMAAARGTAAGDKAGGSGSSGGSGSRAAKSGAARGEAPKPIQDEVTLNIMVPALVDALGPKNAPRVRGLAAAALHNLVDPEHCVSDDIKPFASSLFSALIALVATVPEQFLHTRGNALEAMGNAAMCLDEDFAPFFGQISPALKGVIESPAPSPEKGTFRARAVGCLSTMCEAVGKATSGMDAGWLAQFIIRAQQAGFSADDTTSFQSFSYALVRVAECLGADFAPFFQFALSPLIAKASEVVDVVVSEGDDGDEAGASAAVPGSVGAAPPGAPGAPGSPGGVGPDSQRLTVGVRGQQHNIAFNSQALEDKQVALRCLMVLVADMGTEVEAYSRVVDHLKTPLIAAITDSFSNIRELGWEAAEPLLACALNDSTDRAHGQRMMDELMPALVKRLAAEHQPEGVKALCDAIDDTFRLAYRSTTPNFNGPATRNPPAAPAGAAGAAGGAGKYGTVVIPLAHVPALFAAVRGLYDQSAERRADMVNRMKRNVDADEDDREELEEELSVEDDIITYLTDIVGWCIKTHRAGILPVLSQATPDGGTSLGSYMMPLMSRKDEWDEPMRAAAVCLLDDLVEHASPQAHSLVPMFVPHLIECVLHPNALLRQPATYGVGVCAQFAGEAVAALGCVPALVAKLHQVLSNPDARKGETAGATDNAVSSLLKLARHLPQLVKPDDVMPGVLGYMPLRADDVEARLLHGWLVDGVAASDPFWIGAGGSRASACLRALGRSLSVHAERMRRAEGDDGAEGDDDDVDDEKLFEDDTIAKLSQFAKSGASIAGVLSTLAPKEAAALRAVGFT